jgi:D-glycero-D-manno-heptose 1,7-bisphosphate phosphatase
MNTEKKLHHAAFIDRDGVINEERNYVHMIKDFIFIPGAIEGLRILQYLGYKIVVVTNQAGIAHGLYSEAEYERLTVHMQQELQSAVINITRIYYCPHHPDGKVKELAIACKCRKPRPGMLLAAAVDLGLNLEKSILVGDKQSDIDADKSAGVPINILVETGHVFDTEARKAATVVCKNLSDAANWIASKHITS